MKKSEIKKPKFPILVDTRDYLSNSMNINQTPIQSNEPVKEANLEKTVVKSKNNKPFDLFEHILEG